MPVDVAFEEAEAEYREGYRPDLPDGKMAAQNRKGFGGALGRAEPLGVTEEKFLFHIKEVICDGNQEMYEYYKRWIALPLQNPTRKNKTALLIRSDIQGSGKSWFSEIVCRLHGKFGVENIAQNDTVFRDRFLIHMYMRILIKNMVLLMFMLLMKLKMKQKELNTIEN